MPRLFGHNIIFVIAAAIVMYLIGYLWYGILFMEQYMEQTGLTEGDATPAWRMWGVGIAIPFLYAIGLAAIIAKTGGFGLAHSVKIALICGVMFAAATSLSHFAYEPGHAALLTMFNVSLLIVVFALGGAILSFGRKSEIARWNFRETTCWRSLW